MRISSPPTTHSCYYGIDTPTREELIASSNTTADIAKFIGVDTLKYLSLEGLMECAEGTGLEFCNACFSGEYPLKGGVSGDEVHQLVLFPRRARATGGI